MDYYYTQPKYFSKFKCIGGECPLSCCEDWRIEWKDSDLDKLRKTDASDDLRSRIESSFAKYDDRDMYYVKLREDKSCPFHNKETGLCDIQKELGPDKLGGVCVSFPRQHIGRGYNVLRWCNTSCPAVIDLLAEDEDSVTFEKYLGRDKKSLYNLYIKNENDVIANKDPILKHRFEMLDFYSELFLSEERSIELSIILGGIAAKHLSELADDNKFGEIPSKLKSLRSQLNDPNISGSLDGIKPNYQLKFKLVNNLVLMYTNDIRFISILHDGSELVVERYLQGLENFNNVFKNKNYILRNIIVNEFYDLEMPVGVKERTIFENYSYFVLCSAVLKTIAAAVGYKNSDIINEFKINVSRITRNLAHNRNCINSLMDNMLFLGLTSPAHLALIIK